MNFLFSILLAFSVIPPDSLNNEAKSHYDIKEYAAAISKYQQAAKGYIAIDSMQKAGKSYYNMAKAYYYNYQDSLALSALDSAIHYFEINNDKYNLAATYNLYGTYVSNMGFNEESIEYYNLSIALAKDIGDLKIESFSLNNLGLTFKDIGDYEKAFECLTTSYNLKLKRDAPAKELAASKLNIGLILDYLGKTEESLEAYNEGLRLKRLAGDSLGVAKILSNIAVIYKNKNKDELAKKYILRSNESMEFDTDDELMYVNTTNLGGLLKKSNEYDKAEEYYKEALAIVSRHNALNEMSDCNYNLGELMFVQEKYSLAIDFLNTALGVTDDTKSWVQMQDINAKLAQCYSSIGQHSKAFEKLVLSNQYRDSIYRFEQISSLEELQAKYDTEKKEREIATQKLEIEAKEASLKLNSYIIIGLLIILTLVITIVALLLNRSRRKHELQLQHKEVEHKQNQVIAVIDSQEKERKRFAQDIHDGFGQMISILNLNIASLQEKKKIEDREKLYDQSTSILDGMYEELRTICFDLMPQTLVKQGLPEAIKEFASRINASGKLSIETIIFGIESRLTDLIEVSVYRITQEWVNNIIKHGNADKISIQLTKDENELTLIIEDNGKGFDENLIYNSSGNGWKNISSRANLMMAEINLDTSPNANQTTFIVNVPLSGTPIYHDNGIENEMKK